MSGFNSMADWEGQPLHFELERLRDKSRKSELVRERVLMARDLRSKGYTLQEIGSLLDRHHTTIMHYLEHPTF